MQKARVVAGRRFRCDVIMDNTPENDTVFWSALRKLLLDSFTNAFFRSILRKVVSFFGVYCVSTPT